MVPLVLLLFLALAVQNGWKTCSIGHEGSVSIRPLLHHEIYRVHGVFWMLDLSGHSLASTHHYEPMWRKNFMHSWHSCLCPRCISDRGIVDKVRLLDQPMDGEGTAPSTSTCEE